MIYSSEWLAEAQKAFCAALEYFKKYSILISRNWQTVFILKMYI